MARLGRLFALPLLLIALAAQSLAPAAAATMRPDAGAFGICSAHGRGGGPHRPDPGKGDDHDCCAFACALASLGAAPPGPHDFAPATFETAARLAPSVHDDVASPSPLDRPRSRGPPSETLTG